MNEAAQRDARRARRLRWFVALGAVFMLGVGLVLFYLLALATDHRAYAPQTWSRLLLLNLAVAGVLLAVLLWLGMRLWVRLRRGRFGSRLLLKLAAIFALVGVAPGGLIYLVSYQFVSRAIEAWFDQRVETALQAGLALGRSALDTISAEWAVKARGLASALAGVGDGAAAVMLETWREQLGATDLVLWSAHGRALASAGESRFSLAPQRPAASQWRRARSERVAVWVEGLDELEGLGDPASIAALPSTALPRVRVLALVPADPMAGLGAEPRLLQVTAAMPAALVANALAVQIANREYQERRLAREGLRSMYIGTLTLALFLSVFGAVLLAVLLGNQLARPLIVLAEGMRDVARGDLSPKVALSARDELAGLTRTFADMTRELAEARQAVQASMQQVDAARAGLQTLLDNLTAGVIVLATDGRLRRVNPGAERILGVPLSAHLGQALAHVPGLEALGSWVMEQFARYAGERDSADDGGHWQQQIDHHPPGAASALPRTLVARGAALPGGEWLLVLDDVSELVSAQRAQAWGEVARRLAHEIKNPLTPIQLSAERLAHKLSARLQGADAAMLDKAVRTIVDQVEAMKRLVNEFRDYARLPAAQLAPLDLNALLREIVALHESGPLPVRLELHEPCPPVLADAQQVRQVVHNLVLNAQDAMAAAGVEGAVTLRTQPSRSGQWVRVHVVDQGPGFADAILRRAFEPYVTTKPKGTGLGLAVVKKIMDEHGGRVELTNLREGDRIVGAQVSLSFRVANTQQGALANG
ncbi:Alginate biosynthesis sensor protein KinB [Tepidimonas alkaliphilus]|uniref:histidine kinase n=1 Tax=Tepidimonas alkaliphilus TaxID=2588942 RepID=A0A554W928_9BURK|nr:ATP-binding protein [Tepidimonas alkaliphilus]TSE20073.1 Alginate biosynthesis sensor protein KinB [Tepidimonas alkaliphilus]